MMEARRCGKAGRCAIGRVDRPYCRHRQRRRTREVDHRTGSRRRRVAFDGRLRAEGPAGGLHRRDTSIPDVVAAIKSGLTRPDRGDLFRMGRPRQPANRRARGRDRRPGQRRGLFATNRTPGLVIGRFGTSISAASASLPRLFDGNGFSSQRRVIDVSGDGPNNIGSPVLPARERVPAQGITINGLPIMLGGEGGDPFGVADLDALLSGLRGRWSGAFTLTVSAMDQFEIAIRRKLIQEIAVLGRPFPLRTRRPMRPAIA